VFFSFITVNF